MSLTIDGDSQETVSFPTPPAQERVRRFPVTVEAAARRAGTGNAGIRPRPGRMREPTRRARRHWMLLVLLTAGLTLRVLTQVADRPALLYIDSPKYLAAGLERYDPQGYRLFVLKPLLAVGNLAVVAGFQHLLGLAMATLLYLVLLRRHAPRWAAALATAPLLLDAYQLQMEQTIMPDVTFEALITTGLAILLWNTRPSMPAVALAGFVLGLSATVRQVGEVLVIPPVVFCLLAARGWRYRLAAGGLLLTFSFAIPVLVYMTYSAIILHDRFELSDQGDDVLYGRVAAVADCAALHVPAAERAVCPAPRIAASFGVDGLVNNPTSPAYIALLPTGISHATAVKRFSYAVLEQQPLRVAGAIARDAVKLFALTRDTSPGDTPISRWQFQTAYPVYPDTITLPSAAALFQGNGGGAPAMDRPLATLLRGYQLHGGYTPGPFLLLSLLAGLGGVAAGRRQRRAALACLLVTGAGVVVLLGADFYEFSWRYQLPALVTLPVAGALGASVLQARFRRSTRRRAIRRRAAAARTPYPAVTLGRCPARVPSPTSGPSSPASFTRTPGSG